jgi:exodeoxyribonuclease V alpha subunit
VIETLFADLFEEEKELYSRLMQASIEGHLCIEDAKVANLKPHPLVVADVNRLYLKRNWVDETRVIDNLKRLVGPFPNPPVAFEGLTADQEAAAQMAMCQAVSIITGGPGTGKTHIAKAVAQAVGDRVVLMAPTGKAAAGLQQIGSHVRAGTVHAILGIRSRRDFLKEGSYLPADLVIVDECSMMDASLFAYLLGSISKGTRLVLMGDADQLPAVGSGSLFADLVDLLPTTRLKQVLRSREEKILSLAEAIRRGDGDEVVRRIEPWDERWREGGCILSCMREGPLGVNALNQRFKAVPAPIILKRTNYDVGLYNGETGLLMHDHALFSGDRKIPLGKLPEYEYAYALSVHKSQGSEFDHVTILVPKGSEVFGREVLYTAVTRARHSICLAGDVETIRQTALRSSRKISGLRARVTL